MDSVDGVDSVAAARVERPESEAGVIAALSAGDVVALRGGGTRMDLGPPPPRVDLLLDLSRLSGIIEHHRRDLVVEAWAGTTVADLNAALAPAGQFAPLDPPRPDRATLGGVIAAGETGIRTVPGARPRDLLLGLTAILAGGRRIRAGGRVVKNVTGYELTKLFTGSLGALGAITRVTLRLRALPEATRTILLALPMDDDAGQFADRALDGLAAATAPAAVALVPPGTGLPGLPRTGGFRLAIRFEGLAEEAAAPADPVASAVGAPVEELGEEAAERLWAGVRDAFPRVPRARGELGVAARGPAPAVLRTAWRLAALGPALAFPDQRRALASAPAAAFDLVLAAREPGVSFVVETAPPGWKAEHGTCHPPLPGAVRRLNARLKRALDPEGALASGAPGSDRENAA